MNQGRTNDALLMTLTLIPLVLGAPTALATTGEVEAGACIYAECTWVDGGDIHNCESNGNVAVILGDGNHVNYCHDNSTAPLGSLRI